MNQAWNDKRSATQSVPWPTLCVLCITPFLFGYLPLTWSPKHVAEDEDKSDLIAVVRVVGLRMQEEAVIKEKGSDGQWYDNVWRAYDADLVLLDTVKHGKHATMRYQAGSRIVLAVGAEFRKGKPGRLSIEPASPALTMHNSQNGYDLRIGQTYLLFLSKSKHEHGRFEPRSGPFSIYWLLPEDTYRRKGLSGYGAVKKGWKQLLHGLRKRAREQDKQVEAEGSAKGS